MRCYKHLSAKYSAEYFNFALLPAIQIVTLQTVTCLFITGRKQILNMIPDPLKIQTLKEITFQAPGAGISRAASRTIGGAEYTPNLYSLQWNVSPPVTLMKG